MDLHLLFGRCGPVGRQFVMSFVVMVILPELEFAKVGSAYSFLTALSSFEFVHP